MGPFNCPCIFLFPLHPSRDRGQGISMIRTQHFFTLPQGTTAQRFRLFEVLQCDPQKNQ